MIKHTFSFLLLLLGIALGQAEQLYVNPKTGNDTNSGTKTQPLKTLLEAAKRVNVNKEPEATTIFLSEGVHLLTQTVVFTNDKYTSANRLVIRADVMPDEAQWTPQKMPTVVTAVPPEPGIGGEEAKGIQPEVSHVTIEGLRFTGSPDYSYIDGNNLRRSYPIWRDGKSLDDLLVTQCVFTGNVDVLPLHVGVIANGYGLVIDHCIFFNCKNPVVFWKNDRKTGSRNAMQYSLVYGSYFSGVWTTKDTDGDRFDFHHNIIANASTIWIREKGSTRRYKASDCLFADYTNLAGFGSGPLSGNNATSTDFLEMKNVQTTGTVTIEKDQSKRNYLQLAEGSAGLNLKAGLFKKNQ
ncbi:hypothetical protein [Chryseobacterium jejuense]|uniref:Right handed beta helix domain-containing protein n=1 Tax=Chryseobacterium jejuense TaxID=445960 RepID=A0A2X2VR94_CHRJE|nr:hypothetical protein [Chryseobacterium jejuense]SDJ18030.1 hypothetical protein SAMN05421542_2922 [Chryseobacterium jejuense]SQB28161.1 Uncharacterised protein [Chryseobacterium jejuense]